MYTAAASFLFPKSLTTACFHTMCFFWKHEQYRWTPMRRGWVMMCELSWCSVLCAQGIPQALCSWKVGWASMTFGVEIVALAKQKQGIPIYHLQSLELSLVSRLTSSCILTVSGSNLDLNVAQILSMPLWQKRFSWLRESSLLGTNLLIFNILNDLLWNHCHWLQSE